MTEPEIMSPTRDSSQAPQDRKASTRRARPPDITVTGDDARTPLRKDKVVKRASRVGLKNLFAKGRAGKHDDSDYAFSSLRETPRHGGLRASLADFGNWPYKLHSSRSEVSLVSAISMGSRPSTGDLLAHSEQEHGMTNRDKPLPLAPQKAKAASTTWEPPALFQLHLQAVKHATLPACNQSVEALTRLGEARNSLLLQGETSPSNFNQDQIDDNGTEKKGDSGKKAQRLARAKGALDWTSKIYSLVSSGYLLQYAARGNHDRLPERILQLTKDSAAFASDLIPGRHWVLQVASATDTDGNILSDPKSKKSKLSLKGGEKKQVSSMLLVFESAEMMDEWLAILRHEIESLGGKKKLSETGKPDQESAPPAAFESPPSDRSSVIRDHKRPLSIVTREFSDLHDSPLLGDVQDDFTTLVRERKSEAPASEGSPTASLVSSDDQQLENLRTSENNNRHSYMSSGQKTVFTSSGSSPACSPTRESFSSHGEDLHSFSAASEARLRPNAAAISDRRQSMRYLVSGVELPADTDQRAHASASATASPEDGRQYAAASQQSVPNFSVPHAANKRVSTLNPAMSNSLADHSLSNGDPEGKAFRKHPPTALAESRPLSVVIDQPSPRSSRSARSPSSPNSMSWSWSSNGSRRMQPPPMKMPWINKAIPRSAQKDMVEIPKRNTSLLPAASISRPITGDFSVSDDERAKHMLNWDAIGFPEQIPRSSSALDSYDGTITHDHQGYKRSTMLVEDPFRYSFANVQHWNSHRAGEPSLSPLGKCTPRRSTANLRNSQRVSPPQSRALSARRSMPHLAEGPPPAPPPNCALPPIPSKHAAGLRSIRS